MAGRVLRFEASQDLLRAPTPPSLAEVAAVCGYADQAHLTREWRVLAGTTPGSWLTEDEFSWSEDVE